MFILWAAWLYGTPVQAAPTVEELHVWTETAASGRPDTPGNTRILAAQQLGLNLVTASEWEVSAMGGARLTAPEEPFGRLDLTRLSLSKNISSHNFSFGRFSRMDWRGLARLDGAAADIDPGGPLTVSTWAGRAWSPETWSVGEPWLGGAQLHLRPIVGDAPSRTTEFSAGWETRAGDDISHRVLAAMTTFSPYGHSLLLHAEIEPAAETHLRTGIAGTLPLGKSVSWQGQIRWEGLPPSAALQTRRGPVDWLAPDGYGVATTQLSAHVSPFRASLSGGPTMVPGADLGGVARATAGWAMQSISIGGFGIGASIGHSWTAGGGVDLAVGSGASKLAAQAGIYEFQPLDGDAATVWESRLAATRQLIQRESGTNGRLSVAADIATGSDRILSPWIRAGVALRGSLDRAATQ